MKFLTVRNIWPKILFWAKKNFVPKKFVEKIYLTQIIFTQKISIQKISTQKFDPKFFRPRWLLSLCVVVADPDQGECSNTGDTNSLGQDSRANKIIVDCCHGVITSHSSQNRTEVRSITLWAWALSCSCTRHTFFHSNVFFQQIQMFFHIFLIYTWKSNSTSF